MNPSKYVSRSSFEYRHEYKTELNEKANNRNNLLNKKFPSGRICFVESDDDAEYVALTVSPYHDKFDSQIEDGIKDIVNAFLSKNYMTISSCEGHGWSLDSMYVKLALPSKEDAEILSQKFNDIPYITTCIEDFSANVKMYEGRNGRWSARPLDELEHNAAHEVQSINELFFKNHAKYYFLTITFFEYKYTIFKLFDSIRGIYTDYKKKKYLQVTKTQALSIINNLPEYVK